MLIMTNLLARDVSSKFILWRSCATFQTIAPITFTCLGGRVSHFGCKGVSISLVTSNDARNRPDVEAFHETEIVEMPSSIDGLLSPRPVGVSFVSIP